MQKRTRLLKIQRELLMQWIAEGLSSDEINKRAAQCTEPFKVTRQQVNYYKQQYAPDIKEIMQDAKFQALNTGLALRDVRVDKLRQLAAILEADLLNGKVWLDQKKGVGSGPIAEIYKYREFNKGEVESYRGLLDDIAREIGDRSIKADITANQDGEFIIHFISEAAKEDDGA